MLLAETRIIIASKNVRRYLKKRLMSWSECMYHVANSRIDQVTNRAIGENSTEYWSILILDEILKL